MLSLQPGLVRSLPGGCPNSGGALQPWHAGTRPARRLAEGASRADDARCSCATPLVKRHTPGDCQTCCDKPPCIPSCWWTP